MTITVRPLKAGDIPRLLAIIESCSASTRRAIVEMATQTGSDGETVTVEVDKTLLGLAILEAVSSDSDRVMGFLANLAEIEAEAFNDAPLAAVAEVLDQLIDRPELPDFLERVSGLVTKAIGRIPEFSIKSKPATAGPTAKSNRSH